MDETSDVSRTEQCSIRMSYVVERVVHADLSEFVPVYDATGTSLEKTITQTLHK
jgi:hypothetical protein